MANIIDAATAAGTFTHFLKHVESAGLTHKLQCADPITVFAPTDEAVAQISEATETAISATPHMLENIVKYHVLEGKCTSVDLEGLSTATTLLGEDVEIRFDEGKLKIDGAHITNADIAADNGVIHAIDSVLVPEVAALVLQS